MKRKPCIPSHRPPRPIPHQQHENLWGKKGKSRISKPIYKSDLYLNRRLRVGKKSSDHVSNKMPFASRLHFFRFSPVQLLQCSAQSSISSPPALYRCCLCCCGRRHALSPPPPLLTARAVVVIMDASSCLTRFRLKSRNRYQQQLGSCPLRPQLKQYGCGWCRLPVLVHTFCPPRAAGLECRELLNQLLNTDDRVIIYHCCC